MLAWMLLLHIGQPNTLTVNTIELNHVYDKRCELIYTQVILWDIDASDGKLHNVGWRFVRRCQDMPVRCGKRWMLHADGKTIYAVHFRETWTHFDRERQDSQAFWENEAPNLFEGE